MTLDSIIDAIGVKPYHREPAGVIYCADCLDILPRIPDRAIDLCLTDPPYGLNEKMNGGTWGKKFGEGDMQKWDYLLPQEDFNKISNFDSSLIIWGANNYFVKPSRCWLIWEKPKCPTLSDCEMAWTNWEAPAKSKYLNRCDSSAGHPTRKPIELMTWCIGLDKSNPQTILDPFLGSGTTAVAAKQLGRRYIGIEIEERYCEIAVKRLSQEVLSFGQDDGDTLHKRQLNSQSDLLLVPKNKGEGP